MRVYEVYLKLLFYYQFPHLWQVTFSGNQMPFLSLLVGGVQAQCY